MVSALKGLQEKIRKLELERADAEDNLKKLAAESRHYKDVLQKEMTTRESTQGVISKQNKRKFIFCTNNLCFNGTVSRVKSSGVRQSKICKCQLALTGGKGWGHFLMMLWLTLSCPRGSPLIDE